MLDEDELTIEPERERGGEEIAATIRVAPADLEPDTLRAVIESFVLREGTDYGEHETLLETKVAQVLRQLRRGEAHITFDPATESVNVVVTNATGGSDGSVARTVSRRVISQQMPIEGLILDFGEVLTRSQPRAALERMATLGRLPFDEFISRYWRHRADYDGGLTGEEYWRRVLDGSGSASAAAIADLIDADFQSWSDYRPEVWDIAAAFRARGGRTAMLSNGVPEIVSRLRRERQLDHWFDVGVASCEVGRCKPDPEIYRICLERLGLAAEVALFVDDRMENIRAARDIGLHAQHFLGDSSVSDLRRALSLD